MAEAVLYAVPARPPEAIHQPEGATIIKLLNTVRTPVSIKIGGIAHHGYFEVENGLIRVSYRGSTKPTQLGGSSRTPRVLARLILAELVREATRP